jgi:hypothetical protein
LVDEEAKSKAKEKRENATRPTEEADADNGQEQMDDMERDSLNDKQGPNETQQDDIEQDQTEDNHTDEMEEEEEEGEYETVTSRFVESLLRHLFQGFVDTKVNVRIRCCQIIALSISSMGELE